MVDLPGPTPLRRISAAQQPQPGAAGRTMRKASKNDDGSKEPQLVSLARELASGSPPLDQSRISQIRSAISSGTFRVSPDQIALALLGNK